MARNPSGVYIFTRGFVVSMSWHCKYPTKCIGLVTKRTLSAWLAISSKNNFLLWYSWKIAHSMKYKYRPVGQFFYWAKEKTILFNFNCRRKEEEAALYASLKEAREAAKQLEEEKMKNEEDVKLRIANIKVSNICMKKLKSLQMIWRNVWE